ncbi:MAG: hypothetical protein J5806_12245 [Lentisphaeria bacterium]|nr:hypothetical protein [Lentisphaeria bacterium]
MTNEELVDDVLRIERLMIRDFAAGEISVELTEEIRRTCYRLEIFCHSRPFHFRKNRKLRAAWDDFMLQFAVSRNYVAYPYFGYDTDFAMNEKVNALLRALL